MQLEFVLDDEVIVPTTTMSAGNVPLIYGAIPVFADIEKDTFCIDVARVAEQITSKTKAVIAVNLFGSPADLTGLRVSFVNVMVFFLSKTMHKPSWQTRKCHIPVLWVQLGSLASNYRRVTPSEGGIAPLMIYAATDADDQGSR